MKTSELVLSKILKTVEVVIGTSVIIALVYAFTQIVIGNVHSTASFEF